MSHFFKKPLVIVIICFFILALGVAVFSANKNRLAPVTSTSPEKTAVYRDGELSFSYPAAWKKISSNALFRLQFDNPAPPGKGEIEYFFTPTQWPQVKTLMNQLKGYEGFDPATGRLPMTATAMALLPYMEIDLHRRESRTAKEVAIESTKAICRGKTAPYNKNDPADESKIKETVVAGRKAYLELPQSTCDYQFVTIYFDSTRKNAEGKVDSFQIIFRDASDLAHFNPEQKILLNSIKVK